ncbi:hypothetical protein D3C81_947190 [compost metagenome]
MAEQGADFVGLGKRGNVLCNVLYQQNTTVKQVLDIGRSGFAHFLKIVFQILANGITLQEIVVQSKQGKGDHDDQRGGQ